MNSTQIPTTSDNLELRFRDKDGNNINIQCHNYQISKTCDGKRRKGVGFETEYS